MAEQRRLAAILAADMVGYSRLMEADESGIIERQKAHRAELIEPKITEHNGRIVKTTGDGMLVEFASVVDAVNSAIAIQTSMTEREADVAKGHRIQYRIGINVGDIIIDENDIFGECVNVAARLESLSQPGGIVISGDVFNQIRNRIDATFEDLGHREIKNVSAPIKAYQLRLETTKKDPESSISAADQIIKFCKSIDGVQIAYSTFGEGPPVIIVGNWLTHLELDWSIPPRQAMFEMFAPNQTVVRYDARGNGLSDWDVDEISFEASVSDLITVIDDLGLDRFALLGQSQGAAIAAAYAARNPDKVTHLALYGGYARGRRRRGSEGQVAESEAFVTMIREGWGKDIDSYVQMFGTFFMPDANAEQLAKFTKFQRSATPPENAARIQLALDEIDITDELANISAPTLVLHVREDARVPFDEGRRLAAAIPDARFVPLEGRNHTMLLGEPALTRYLNEITSFLNS